MTEQMLELLSRASSTPLCGAKIRPQHEKDAAALCAMGLAWLEPRKSRPYQSLHLSNAGIVFLRNHQDGKIL